MRARRYVLTHAKSSALRRGTVTYRLCALLLRSGLAMQYTLVQFVRTYYLLYVRVRVCMRRSCVRNACTGDAVCKPVKDVNV